jgi:hypothetical protein
LIYLIDFAPLLCEIKNNPLLVKIPGMISEKLANKPKLCQFSQNSLKNCPKKAPGGGSQHRFTIKISH